jgi:hypothetical protein
MDPGGVQDFSRVEIADARNGTLVEQGDFDFAPAPAKLLLKLSCGDGECVGTKFFRTQFYGKLFVCEQLHRAQAPAIPEEESLGAFPSLVAFSEMQAETQVLFVGRIGQQQQPGHTGLEDEHFFIIEAEYRTFSHPLDFDNLGAHELAPQSSRLRLHLNRLEATARPLDRSDRTTSAGSDAAAHGFDLGQFGHVDASSCWDPFTA